MSKETTDRKTGKGGKSSTYKIIRRSGKKGERQRYRINLGSVQIEVVSGYSSVREVTSPPLERVERTKPHRLAKLAGKYGGAQWAALQEQIRQNREADNER